jgi:hypothetical protein
VSDDDQRAELAEETIEDLEAPAYAQEVTGGANGCATPTCVGGSKVKTYCDYGTCAITMQKCLDNTGTLVVYAK